MKRRWLLLVGVVLVAGALVTFIRVQNARRSELNEVRLTFDLPDVHVVIGGSPPAAAPVTVDLPGDVEVLTTDWDHHPNGLDGIASIWLATVAPGHTSLGRGPALIHYEGLTALELRVRNATGTEEPAALFIVHGKPSRGTLVRFEGMPSDPRGALTFHLDLVRHWSDRWLGVPEAQFRVVPRVHEEDASRGTGN